MRILAILALIAGLALPAYAQSQMEGQDRERKAELDKAIADKKKESQEIEKAYNETMRKTRDQTTAKKMDPWANMR